jgi:hypothetical protein
MRSPLQQLRFVRAVGAMSLSVKDAIMAAMNAKKKVKVVYTHQQLVALSKSRLANLTPAGLADCEFYR